MLRLYVSKGAYKVAAEIRDTLTQCVCQGAEVLTVAGFKELFVTAAARFREVVGGGGIFEKLFRDQSQRTDYSGMLRIFRMKLVKCATVCYGTLAKRQKIQHR